MLLLDNTKGCYDRFGVSEYCQMGKIPCRALLLMERMRALWRCAPPVVSSLPSGDEAPTACIAGWYSIVLHLMFRL